MSRPIRFILRGDPGQRIDVSPLTPNGLQCLSLESIRKIPLHVGSYVEEVGGLFEIEGDNTQSIRFENPRGKLDLLGKGMRHGLIEVEGDAGSYLGMQMRGGVIKVKGSVDAFAACEMIEGKISIDGDAGDFLGAALPGSKKGMRGGLVQIFGDAGDRVGDHMRRGIILIKGSSGEYLGSRMTAGTILVEGCVGRFLGYGMNRGTILLVQTPEFIPPTFSNCGRHSIGFLSLFFRNIQVDENLSLKCLSDLFVHVHRYSGDVSALGQGEILVAQDTSTLS